MSAQLPPVSLWEQFYVIGIVVLVLAVLLLGARYIFREFTAWQAAEERRRDEHRKEMLAEQQAWMIQVDERAEASRITRDHEWQAFLRKLTLDNCDAITNLTEISRTLSAQMDLVLKTTTESLKSLQAHDETVKLLAEELRNGRNDGATD